MKWITGKKAYFLCGVDTVWYVRHLIGPKHETKSPISCQLCCTYTRSMNHGCNMHGKKWMETFTLRTAHWEIRPLWYSGTRCADCAKLGEPHQFATYLAHHLQMYCSTECLLRIDGDSNKLLGLPAHILQLLAHSRVMQLLWNCMWWHLVVAVCAGVAKVMMPPFSTWNGFRSSFGLSLARIWTWDTWN